MISLRASHAANASTLLTEITRQSGESNLDWLARAAKATGQQLAAQPKSAAVTPRPDNCPWVILVGGRDAAHLRLRMAQSHARSDLTPSHWSHVLLTRDAVLKQAWHIPLCAPAALGFPPTTNGVQEVALKHYASAADYPNLAILNVPVPGGKPLAEIVGRFKMDRAALDAVELVAAWLAFLWGVGRFGNPLLDAQGVPSAVFIESVMAASQLDLSPGLANRASCPEAIWQSAKWWNDYHVRDGQHGLFGAYCTDHKLV
jgi:hypothetical protein